MATSLHETTQSKPPLWRNIAVLKWASQLAVLAAVVILGFLLIGEAASNLEAKGISTSFDFLSDPPGIAIAEGIDVRPGTGARALYVGIVNMLRITLSGIIAATILGTIIGVARLSHNWIVNKIATVYIETIRNIPLLVQILFFAAVIALSLPEIDLDLGPFAGWLLASNKGISVRSLFPDDGFYQWLAFVIVGSLVARTVYQRRTAVKMETGQETYAVTSAIGVIVASAIIGWWAHPIMGFIGLIFGAISSVIGVIPTVLVQILLAVLVLGAAGWWIKRFLDNLRTPAGLAKLTDDDYFRIISAALFGLVLAGVFLFRAGIADWIVNAGEDFFAFLDAKFEWLRTGAPLRVGVPEVVQPGNFANFGPGGLTMTAAFAAVWLGVTLYTAAFIAEIVRAGVLAVPMGQTEASAALGLKRSQQLRFIVLPQALRIILPPMGSQYLNLAKNTSLGIAVAYPEVVSVGQTLYNQTGATIPVVILWMAFYLSVSLSISFVVNWYNRRIQLVER